MPLHFRAQSIGAEHMHASLDACVMSPASNGRFLLCFKLSEIKSTSAIRRLLFRLLHIGWSFALYHATIMFVIFAEYNTHYLAPKGGGISG